MWREYDDARDGVIYRRRFAGCRKSACSGREPKEARFQHDASEKLAADPSKARRLSPYAAQQMFRNMIEETVACCPF
jgi:hypothetical protein